MEFQINAMDFQAAGKASSKLKKVLQQLGIPSANVRRICISAYEMEMNLVIHGGGGKLLVQIAPDEVVIEAVDDGPGIPDVEKAMEEGFSTADPSIRELGFGAGMGLPNIKKNSDSLKIRTAIGQGTDVKAVVKL